MSHRGFSIARNLRTIPKKGLQVDAMPLPVHRKDATQNGKRLLALGDANGAAARPHVYLDVAIDGRPAGRIECELFSDAVPKTAENFRALCTGEKGQGHLGKDLHFKNCPFHRIVPNFVIHGGDIVKGDGSSGESIYGAFFEDESFDLKHDQPGLLSMANLGRPDTNSSQFFIMSRPQPSMDNKYVVFGRVTKGMDVVRRVESCGTSETGEVRTAVKGMKSDVDELVSYRPKRNAYIVDSGEMPRDDAGAPSLSLALEDTEKGPAPKRHKIADEVFSFFHLVKKHKDARDPKTWRGVKATCSKGKAKTQVANLRKRLEAAASAVQAFADIAREHSDSPSAQRGGDLGVITKGSLEAELEDAAFGLGPGQLSEVIETHEGIHLILRATG
jgi:peptidylprolyl isomerase